MKRYYVRLYYGYEETPYGIYHSFNLADTEEWRDDAVFDGLADSLDCERDDDRFGCDVMDVVLPLAVVERIKKEAVEEYINEKDTRVI